MRRFCALTAAVLMLGLSGGARTGQAQSRIDGEMATSRLETYVKPDGEAFFSLSLAPTQDIANPPAMDVVVLFDTSASQAGAYREKAFVALQALLERLGGKDRVHLLAVDLFAVPMTTGFVSPGAKEMSAALDKLHRRLPLGSTDMDKALRGAIGAVEGRGGAHAAVYIGDGISTANLFETEAFRRLVGDLANARLPVTSYAIGPKTDARLLAILANQTGGNLAVAREMIYADEAEGVSAERANVENRRLASEAGGYLADSARAAVLWPTSIDWPAAMAEVYPSPAPPLRNDRDAIVIGAGSPRGELPVKMTLDSAGRSIEMAWKVKVNTANDDHAYLDRLVNLARRDDGLTLPTPGTAGLTEARRMLRDGVENLTALAEHAVATGNAESAQWLAGEALRRDPGNPAAQAIRRTANRVAIPLGRSGGGDLRMVKQVAPEFPPAEDVGPIAAQDGAFLDEVEQRHRVITGMIEAEVTRDLEDARDRMASDPEGAIQLLKLRMEMVRRAPELDPNTRSQLVDQLEAAMKESERRSEEKDEQDRIAQEAAAQAREQQRIADRLLRDQEKMRQLMARMNSLVDEGRYPEAMTEVGPEISALVASTQLRYTAGPTAVAANLATEYQRYVAETEAIVAAKNSNFVLTLLSTERSAIPFPDEPPIVYPPAPVWEELTIRRKKYASVDLKKRGGAEEKIGQELDEPTAFEFIETPLRDVVDYLKDLHQIEIQIDQKALEDVGIGTDTPITRNLKGVSLRSALRLMLRSLDLTYTIQDEVLLITTPEVVESNLTTKVYPVADLVLPIPQMQSVGGLGGLGQGGGAGGGMLGGGGGGGMGGGGGGFGGGGMGGGGGQGFF